MTYLNFKNIFLFFIEYAPGIQVFLAPVLPKVRKRIRETRPACLAAWHPRAVRGRRRAALRSSPDRRRRRWAGPGHRRRLPTGIRRELGRRGSRELGSQGLGSREEQRITQQLSEPMVELEMYMKKY